MTTCKHCGATGLQWRRSSATGRWVLLESAPDGDGTLQIDNHGHASSAPWLNRKPYVAHSCVAVAS